jgi:spore germination protein YaaH
MCQERKHEVWELDNRPVERLSMRIITEFNQKGVSVGCWQEGVSVEALGILPIPAKTNALM